MEPPTRARGPHTCLHAARRDWLYEVNLVPCGAQNLAHPRSGERPGFAQGHEEGRDVFERQGGMMLH